MLLLSFSNFINSSIFWENLLSIVGVIVGVISILVTIISIAGIFLPHNKSNPKYSRTVRPRKQNAAVTRIAIWNSGKTLLPSDLIKKSPLCIKVKDENTRIIDCSLIYSEEKNDIRYLRPSDDGKVIYFTFDLLRNNEGFVVDVVHTGSFKDLQAEGSLIEGGDILFIPPSPRKNSIILCITNALAAIIYSVCFIMILADNSSPLYNYPKIIIIVLMAMFPAMIIMLIKLTKTKFSSMFTPKKIDKILFDSYNSILSF